MMKEAMAEARASTLWILLITLASAATTVAFACATPVAALAALAATHMRSRDGVTLVLLGWAISQGVGFGIHHYPLTGVAIGWGAVLAVGGVAAVFAARVAAGLGSAMPMRQAEAYLAGFVAFKLVILAAAFALEGGWAALAPAIVLRQFVGDGAILIGLLALYHALVAAGLPPAPAAGRVMPDHAC